MGNTIFFSTKSRKKILVGQQFLVRSPATGRDGIGPAFHGAMVPTASFKSCDRFTEFLAHSQIFARKPKQWNLELKLRPYLGSMTHKIS